MRPVLAHVCSLSLSGSAWLSLANSAVAQSAAAEAGQARPAAVQVTREAGAESCASTEELSAHVERLRGQTTASNRSTYRVTFSRRSGVFRAVIRMAGGSARVLEDRGTECASLERATALTLALLLDSDAHELTVEDHAQEPPEAEEAPSIEPSAVVLSQPAGPRPRLRLAFAAGAGALLGVVRTAAPVAVADANLYVNRFHTSLGVLWMPTQQIDFAPGRLRELLLSGVARTCYAPLQRRRLSLEACTGVYAGLLSVEARGYTRNDALKRAWLAVPLELSLSTAAPPVGLELGVSALLPLRQSDFAIDNLGAAYESWPFAMLVTLRALGIAAL